MDTPTNQSIVIPPSASPDRATLRELAVASWLAEKAELSQSIETKRAYDAMMTRFRQTLALDRVAVEA